MIWYVIGAVVAFDLAFVMGCAWKAQHSVPVATFDEALEMVLEGQRREAQLGNMLKASNRLLEQATKKREPDAIDWSVLGV